MTIKHLINQTGRTTKPYSFFHQVYFHLQGKITVHGELSCVDLPETPRMRLGYVSYSAGVRDVAIDFDLRIGEQWIEQRRFGIGAVRAALIDLYITDHSNDWIAALFSAVSAYQDYKRTLHYSMVNIQVMIEDRYYSVMALALHDFAVHGQLTLDDCWLDDSVQCITEIVSGHEIARFTDKRQAIRFALLLQEVTNQHTAWPMCSVKTEAKRLYTARYTADQ